MTGIVERVLPRITSVDDHVVEPPNVWLDRLPRKYADVAPRVHRERTGAMAWKGGTREFGETDDRSVWADWWCYEDLRFPLTRLHAAVGFERDEVKLQPITFEDMRPGCFQVEPRLADMDINGIEASLCFPTFARFCGQTFLEASDKELALLGVRAYNDWMVEDWCGQSGGRLIPNCLIPLWDPELAAEEVRRNAARGVRAVCFSEGPTHLGLPSVHDDSGWWDPFVEACSETETVINMHIGSSSHLITTSPDAPPAAHSVLIFNHALWALTDWLFCGYLERFPDLRICLSEGQIGWIPYVLDRADKVWDKHRGFNQIRDRVPNPPSTYFHRQIYACFFDDPVGITLLDEIGVDNVTFETDYPHADSTWPDSAQTAASQLAGLPGDVVAKILSGNARRMLGLV